MASLCRAIAIPVLLLTILLHPDGNVTPKSISASELDPETALTLTVQSSNPNSGVVISANPADVSGKISGTTAFLLSYASGTSVALSPPPTAGGNSFGSWTGCDSVDGQRCIIAMDSNATVTANYIGSTSSPGSGAIVVGVQPATALQTWEAWRATATGPYFRNSQDIATLISPSLLSAILDDLAFDLRLNGIRLEQHDAQRVEITNDDSDPHHIVWSAFNFDRQYTADFNASSLVDLKLRVSQVIQPLAQRVKSRGEPFYVYVDPMYNGTTWPAHWNNAQEYAEYAQALVMWMRGQSQPASGLSLTPDYWVIVNEPESHGFSATKIAGLIPAVASRFQSLGLNIKIETVESANPTASTYLNTVLNTPGVAPVVGLITYHGYDYSTGQVPSFTARNNLRNIAQQRGKRTGMTEVCCKQNWKGGYAQALGWARDIFWNMTQANISVWEPLGMAQTCGSVGCTTPAGSPINIDLNMSAYYKLANYYGLRQYTRYIRPNYVRIGTSCTNCGSNTTVGQVVKPVVFRSPGGKFVAVVVNDSTASQTIYLGGLPGNTYDIIGVDPTHARTPVNYTPQTIGSGGYLKLTFPAQAIVTFVGR